MLTTANNSTTNPVLATGTTDKFQVLGADGECPVQGIDKSTTNTSDKQGSSDGNGTNEKENTADAPAMTILSEDNLPAHREALATKIGTTTETIGVDPLACSLAHSTADMTTSSEKPEEDQQDAPTAPVTDKIAPESLDTEVKKSNAVECADETATIETPDAAPPSNADTGVLSNEVTEADGETNTKSDETKKLLVLVSNQSFNREVTVNQEHAFTILDSKGIIYQTLDGADPENKEKRNELFNLSGLRGKYPQFFVEEGNGNISFWGDWERFEMANDDGNIQTELGTQSVEVQNQVAINAMKDKTACTTVVDASKTAAEANITDASSSEVGTPPEASAKCKVVMLVSSQSFNREVTANQEHAYTILTSKAVPFETVDGADPNNKDVRNDLFTLSGLRGKYPQFFVHKEDGTLDFWGDWDHFQAANEMGSIPAEFGVHDKEPTNDKTLVVDDQSHSSIAANNPKPDTPVEESAGEAATNPLDAKDSKLLVLVSRQSLNREVTANQENAFTILKSKGIHYETLDGADPQNKDMRNDLFAKSGLRGKYPQFFIRQSDGSLSFWGDWDQFELANETGSLVTEFGSGDGPSVTELGAGSGSSEPSEKVTPAASETKPSSASADDNAGSKNSSEEAEEGDASVGVETLSKANTMSLASADKTDITVYGATSFVARHVLTYLRQVSLSFDRDLKVTLAGRSASKVQALCQDNTAKMGNLTTMKPDASGKCIFDTFVAEGSDGEALEKMAKRTQVVLSCAGPFAKYSSNVVAACAKVGCDYIDITGEVSWAGEMREKYSELSAKSGARIISFCGFDSIPSDLAVLITVEALREATKDRSVDVEEATTWHESVGGVNGGTIHTVVDMPSGLDKLFRRVPFLVDDPLVLVHPKTKVDTGMEETRRRFAKAEWMNLLPNPDINFRMGWSIPFFMAPVNAKVVQASAIALKYGRNFKYRERYMPAGYQFTAQTSLSSIIIAAIFGVPVLIGFAILKTPLLGKMIANWLLPPWTGSDDRMCKAGHAYVYAEAKTQENDAGAVDKASCLVKFKGDPGNWVTAQCVSESALTLVLNRDDLPPRSEDGFGTPAELLGKPLLARLQETTLRPVKVETQVRKSVPKNEWQTHPDTYRRMNFGD